MYKTLIVDDHPFIRVAVKMILQQEHFEIVGEANNGSEAIQLVRDLVPDLVVLDIAMPGLDGLEVIRRIKNLGVKSKILVLTALPATTYSARCRMLGAAGYVAKVDDLDELRKALGNVMSGYTVFPSLESDSVRRTDNTSEHDAIHDLTDRELVILRQLAQGMSNKAIAEVMLLSNKTISAHKVRLFEKLNVDSQVGLAELAKRNDLI